MQLDWCHRCFRLLSTHLICCGKVMGAIIQLDALPNIVATVHPISIYPGFSSALWPQRANCIIYGSCSKTTQATIASCDHICLQRCSQSNVFILFTANVRQIVGRDLASCHSMSGLPQKKLCVLLVSLDWPPNSRVTDSGYRQREMEAGRCVWSFQDPPMTAQWSWA